MARQISFHEYRMQAGRGGPRKGAGRKPSGRRCDPKRAREKFDRLTAVHVTLRVSDEVRSLRSRAFIAEIRASFLALKQRAGECEVSRPRSWLLSKGWRRYGPIDPALIPGSV